MTILDNLKEEEIKDLQELLKLLNNFKAMHIFAGFTEEREEPLDYKPNPNKNEISIRINYREELRNTGALFGPGEKLVKDNRNGTKVVAIPARQVIGKSVPERLKKFEHHLRDKVFALIKKELPND